MKYLFSIFVFSIFSLVLVGQNESSSAEVFTVVEQMPRFPGCEAYYDSLATETNSFSKVKSAREECAQQKLMEFLGSIKYPEKAVKKKLEGKVFLRFVVDEMGGIVNLEIARSSGHSILDETAVEHLQRSPNWIPGKQRGKFVKVQYVVPINFNL